MGREGYDLKVIVVDLAEGDGEVEITFVGEEEAAGAGNYGGGVWVEEVEGGFLFHQFGDLAADIVLLYVEHGAGGFIFVAGGAFGFFAGSLAQVEELGLQGLEFFGKDLVAEGVEGRFQVMGHRIDSGPSLCGSVQAAEVVWVKLV